MRYFTIKNVGEIHPPHNSNRVKLDLSLIAKNLKYWIKNWHWLDKIFRVIFLVQEKRYNFHERKLSILYLNAVETDRYEQTRIWIVSQLCYAITTVVYWSISPFFVALTSIQASFLKHFFFQKLWLILPKRHLNESTFIQVLISKLFLTRLRRVTASNCKITLNQI